MRRCITTLVKVYSRQCLLRLPSFRRRANTYVFLQPSFCLESHVSFNSRPNVRGTLVAVEKAASHSVSLFTIIVWGARSRFKGLQAHLAELLDSQQLMFPFRFIIHYYKGGGMLSTDCKNKSLRDRVDYKFDCRLQSSEF